MDHPRYRAPHAAFVAVQSQKYLVLVKKPKDYLWGLAGGRAQPSETPLDTAQRKLRDELGITVSGDGLKEVASRPNRSQMHHLYSYEISDEAAQKIQGIRNGYQIEIRKKVGLSHDVLEEHIVGLIQAMAG